MSNLVATAINVGLWIAIIVLIMGLLPVSSIPPDIANAFVFIVQQLNNFSYLINYNQLIAVLKWTIYYELAMYTVVGAMWLMRRLTKTGSN